MSKLLYFLATFAESALSVFGVRGTYDQPHYTVVQTIARQIEIRDYAPRVAVQTAVGDGGDGAAFGRLFRYITGANVDRRTVAMTVPVAQTPRRIAMTVPVETADGQATMRFFLPDAVVVAGIPVPTDKAVQIVHLPAVTLGVLRYSGVATEAVRARQTDRLRRALAEAGRGAQGDPVMFSYDPPFAIPFLRRNEVALRVRP